MTRRTIYLKNMTIEYEDLGRLNRPYFEEYRNAFNDVLDSGWFVLGSSVKQFESEFAKYLGANYCAGVASGLDALVLSLRSLNIEPNTEVIVPSNTYIATILSIIQCGLIPVLVEPDIKTYNINPDLIQEKITSKTRGVMVVHLYGKPCSMDSIVEICKKNNLYLIEDCAQAHGAEFNGKKVGNFGHVSAFSFYPTKNLGCLGDGGAVVTNNPDYDSYVRMIRNYGFKKKYHCEEIGINSRLDEVQAAFLRVKLQHLDSINQHKRKLAKMYFDNLKSDFILPHRDSNCKDVYHIFNVRHEKRDDLMAYLFRNGIKTEIHYPVAPNKQNALKKYNLGDFPISELIHATTLSLPISAGHTEDEIYHVIDVMNRF